MGRNSVPLERTAGTITNLRTIIVAAIGVITGVFGAGIYWHQLNEKIDTAYNLATKADAALSEIRPKIDDALKISTQLKGWGALPASYKDPSVSGPWGGKTNGPSMCPDGYYMIGVRTSSNEAPPYCIGCLNGAQAICRPLNVKD